jgi:hypothetical protein
MLPATLVGCRSKSYFTAAQARAWGPRVLDAVADTPQGATGLFCCPSFPLIPTLLEARVAVWSAPRTSRRTHRVPTQVRSARSCSPSWAAGSSWPAIPNGAGSSARTTTPCTARCWPPRRPAWPRSSRSGRTSRAVRPRTRSAPSSTGGSTGSRSAPRSSSPTSRRGRSVGRSRPRRPTSPKPSHRDRPGADRPAGRTGPGRPRRQRPAGHLRRGPRRRRQIVARLTIQVHTCPLP